MPDYSKAVIYRIINRDTGENLYVGSTCRYNERMSEHKSDCNNPNKRHYNYPIYQHIRELGGWSAVRHVMIEQYTDWQDRLQLVKKEQEYIDQFSGTKNAVKSYITIEQRNERMKQYNNDNKAAIKEQLKKYYSDNKAAINEYQKQYNNDNKAAISEYQRQYRLKKKQQPREEA